MQFNAARFNRFLNNIGQSFLWRRAYACPCINPRSKQPAPGCPQCGGRGHLHVEPVKARAGVAGGSVQRKWAQLGRYETGDLVLAVPGDSPMWGMGEFDRVTSLNATDAFSTRLTRGAQGERLFSQPASLERLFWLDDAGGIVEGALPVMVGGVPSWPAGDGPPPGKTYSLTGTKALEYFVFTDMPHSRNQHHGMKLPQSVVLRKWDLLGRGATTSA
jgi:hypothetical protein